MVVGEAGDAVRGDERIVGGRGTLGGDDIADVGSAAGIGGGVGGVIIVVEILTVDVDHVVGRNRLDVEQVAGVLVEIARGVLAGGERRGAVAHAGGGIARRGPHGSGGLVDGIAGGGLEGGLDAARDVAGRAAARKQRRARGIGVAVTRGLADVFGDGGRTRVGGNAVAGEGGAGVAGVEVVGVHRIGYRGDILGPDEVDGDAAAGGGGADVGVLRSGTVDGDAGSGGLDAVGDRRAFRGVPTHLGVAVAGDAGGQQDDAVVQNGRIGSRAAGAIQVVLDGVFEVGPISLEGDGRVRVEAGGVSIRIDGCERAAFDLIGVAGVGGEVPALEGMALPREGGKRDGAGVSEAGKVGGRRPRIQIGGIDAVFIEGNGVTGLDRKYCVIGLHPVDGLRRQLRGGEVRAGGRALVVIRELVAGLGAERGGNRRAERCAGDHVPAARAGISIGVAGGEGDLVLVDLPLDIVGGNAGDGIGGRIDLRVAGGIGGVLGELVLDVPGSDRRLGDGVHLGRGEGGAGCDLERGRAADGALGGVARDEGDRVGVDLPLRKIDDIGSDEPAGGGDRIGACGVRGPPGVPIGDAADDRGRKRDLRDLRSRHGVPVGNGEGSSAADGALGRVAIVYGDRPGHGGALPNAGDGGSGCGHKRLHVGIVSQVGGIRPDVPSGEGVPACIRMARNDTYCTAIGNINGEIVAAGSKRVAGILGQNAVGARSERDRIRSRRSFLICRENINRCHLRVTVAAAVGPIKPIQKIRNRSYARDVLPDTRFKIIVIPGLIGSRSVAIKYVTCVWVSIRRHIPPSNVINIVTRVGVTIIGKQGFQLRLSDTNDAIIHMQVCDTFESDGLMHKVNPSARSTPNPVIINYFFIEVISTRENTVFT